MEPNNIPVMLDIKLGDKFASLEQFVSKLEENTQNNYVQFYRRDSRTVESAKRRLKRNLNSNLLYYSINYTCIHGGREHVSKGTGKKNRKTLRNEHPCPACVKIRIDETGNEFEVIEVNNGHNHQIDKDVFQHLVKQRALPPELKEEAKKLLRLKANKRLLRAELERQTGKMVTMKDLRNLEQADKRQHTNNIRTVVDQFNIKLGPDCHLFIDRDKNVLTQQEKPFIMKNQTVFRNLTNPGVIKCLPDVPEENSMPVSISKHCKKNTLTQQEKYKLAFSKCKLIALLCSKASGVNFDNNLDALDRFIHLLERNCDNITDLDDQEDQEDNSEIEETPETQVDMPLFTQEGDCDQLNIRVIEQDANVQVEKIPETDDFDLQHIIIPPVYKKRVRPAGRSLAVMGVPPRKKKKEMLPFNKLKRAERANIILKWVLRNPSEVYKKKIIKTADLLDLPDVDIRLSEISLPIVKSLFSTEAFNTLKRYQRSIVNNGQWTCPKCNRAILKIPAIRCDLCLRWYHSRCLKVNMKISSVLICPSCNS